jgi:hypothetical protein
MLIRTASTSRATAIALLTLATHNACAAPGTADQCIVGDRAIGCVSERSIIELTIPRKDAAALRNLVDEKLASGQCRLFAYGERVSLISTKGTERSFVRRPGDKASYWIPSSWSRPASECESNASAATLHRKLGLQEPSLAQTDAEPSNTDLADNDAQPYTRSRDDDAGFHEDYDERRFSQIHDDDRMSYPPNEPPPFAHRRGADDAIDAHDISALDGPPPLARWPSRPLPSTTYAQRYRCTYKPVMSDAEVASCRDESR